MTSVSDFTTFGNGEVTPLRSGRPKCGIYSTRLGHGPFSHFYDGHFLSRVNPTAKWRHEEGSVKVFEHMLNANPKLRATLDEFLCERDYSFIKELIDPPKEFIKVAASSAISVSVCVLER